MNTIQTILNKIESTFRKDNIRSAPREELENVIIEIYDDLNELKQSGQE